MMSAKKQPALAEVERGQPKKVLEGIAWEPNCSTSLDRRRPANASQSPQPRHAHKACGAAPRLGKVMMGKKTTSVASPL